MTDTPFASHTVDHIGRVRTSFRLLCGTLFVVALTSGCGGDDSTGPATPGLHVVSGADQADTVLTKLAAPLVIEIRDSTGRSASGVTVRFQGVGGNLAMTPDQKQYDSFVSAIADARGHASVFVRLGPRAGTARLAITVPELGAYDTVSFTIKHGSPIGLAISPSDTSLLPGQSFTLAAVVADMFGNTVPEAVPTFSSTTGIAVTPTGKVTASSTLALNTITATYQKLTDSAHVSIIPLFPMVVNKGGAAMLVNTDGTGRIALIGPADISIAPSSVPATPSVVYYQGDPAVNSKVMVVQPNQAPRPLLSVSTSADAWPRLSPDGVWVYFVRDLNTLWRARLDGTGLEQLGTFSPPRVYRWPTVSPDGKSVAVEDGTGLRIFDVTTKGSSTVPGPCGYPAYSPDGAFFACGSATDLSVMRTDGTGRRVAHQFDLNAYPSVNGPVDLSGIDWSPDGKWLLAIAGRYANLYDVAKDAVLPLSGMGIDFSQASFVR